MIEILIAIGVSVGISAILGLVLAIADKFLRVEEDPRLEVVTSLLPGANCGGCGFPGCSGFAAAIVNKESATLAPCRVAKAEAKEAIKNYLRETPGPDGTTIEVK
jgi:electron transport complex protein RnfB